MPTNTSTPALSREASTPLAKQLAARYAERIQQRLLLPGQRLPSVRECARHHNVSPYTVVAAYDQLLAQGLLEARKQRGFFVRESMPTPARTPINAAPVRHTPVDASALIRGMFQADAKRAPGLGTLPAEWLDLPMIHTAMRKVLSEGDASAQLALHYGEPAGDARLRVALAQRLSDIGLNAAPEQIVTTVGATHALDLLTRSLLQPGDAVLVDDPGWAIEFARLSQAGMRLLPVPRGADGPDLAVMAQLVAQHAPKLYVTVSVLHNPTGNSLSLANAYQLLRMAEQGNFLIVEDDTYAFLAPTHMPRLSALDGLRRTVYVSGFSKILTPAWRVGYVAANSERIARLTELKLISTLTTSPVPERAVAHCLEKGLLRRHAERVMSHLDAARQRSLRLAVSAGCQAVTPAAGLFGWIDTGMDTERLAQRMMDQNWLIAPGALFSPTRRASTLMRINFATSQDAQFWKLLAQFRRDKSGRH
ncbi:aminotransferase-like domain-containing protein [Roseateles koreensis]|uniref:PLP-dependent aminotransferase family protein n=1 Tax=Roseateles koreensis TaxID=2987526 RepID=A0ABT5KQ24_9BURK|nr:PLP-dependent aminotransferase family protein [Roseateles koreensis]MDC8784951.1 PLP-dependent aminotransferase family protein [Roseateles koreensis]